jgi:hypothetical protein
MIRFLKTTILFNCLLFCLSIFASCNSVTLTKIEVQTSTKEIIAGSFFAEDFSLKIIFSDNSYNIIPLNLTMISDSDILKFNIEGNQNITVKYKGLSTQFDLLVLSKTDVQSQNLKAGVLSGFYLNSNDNQKIISFKNLLTQYKNNNIDTLIFCGNMISGTSIDDYNVLQNALTDIYGENLPKILYTMGSSEWLLKTNLSENEAKAEFIKFADYEDINYYTEINNTGFLCISGEDITANISVELNKKIKLWLLKKGNTDSPLFVVYNSEYSENKINNYYFQNTAIYNTLKEYQNVILIDGNSKYSVYNERAIIQNEFTTIFCGISNNQKITNEINNFYIEKELISTKNYNLKNYGLKIDIKKENTEVERITDEGSLTDTWLIKNKKENFSYTSKNYFNGSKNGILLEGNINCNYSIENESANLLIKCDLTTQLKVECFKLIILSENYAKEFYILNNNYDLIYSYSNTFKNFPLGNYIVYLYAVNFYGIESENYLYCEQIISELPDIPDNEDKTEINDLINDLSEYNSKLFVDYDEINVSKNSLKSLKVTGQIDNNFFPEIIFKPDNGFYNLENKIINFDAYFINAHCSFSVYIAFNDGESLSLNCEFSKIAEYDCWLNSSINFNEYADLTSGSFKEITEIKIILCLDSSICTEEASIIYLDNIFFT